MNLQTLMTQSLPPEPELVVSGKPVTLEQAADILIRTDLWYWSGNSRQLRDEVQAIMLPNMPGEDRNAQWEYEEKRKEELGVITLEYLYNAQIVSSYIGGPHGWCAWDGTIRTRGTNVGKWPSCGELLDEWQKIVKAFPYLDLTARIMSGEAGEADSIPVIDFVLTDGKVSPVVPRVSMIPPSSNAPRQNMFAVLTEPPYYREAGVEREYLAKAVRSLEERRRTGKSELAP